MTMTMRGSNAGSKRGQRRKLRPIRSLKGGGKALFVSGTGHSSGVQPIIDLKGNKKRRAPHTATLKSQKKKNSPHSRCIVIRQRHGAATRTRHRVGLQQGSGGMLVCTRPCGRAGWANGQRQHPQQGVLGAQCGTRWGGLGMGARVSPTPA